MTRPWVKYLLFASLALNLLVAGAFASAAFRARQVVGGGAGVFGFIDHLPKERRDHLQGQVREARMEIRRLREQVRSAARDRAAALLAEPFDKQQYLDAQNRFIEADMKLRRLMRDAVAAIAGQMSQAERRKFVHWRGARRMIGDGPEDAPKRP